MEQRRLNNWRRWLQPCSLVLLVLAVFAPLPETPSKILLLLAALASLASLLTDSPEARKETARFLIPMAAWLLLALLIPMHPKLVFYGFIAIFAGICLWDVFKSEHAEYLAKRKHLQ